MFIFVGFVMEFILKTTYLSEVDKTLFNFSVLWDFGLLIRVVLFVVYADCS